MEKWENIAIRINKQNWTCHQLVVPVRATYWAILIRKEYMSKLSQLMVVLYKAILISGKISKKEQQVGTCWILHEMKSSTCSKHWVTYLYPGEKCFEYFLNAAYRKIGLKKPHFFAQTNKQTLLLLFHLSESPNSGGF